MAWWKPKWVPSLQHLSRTQKPNHSRCASRSTHHLARIFIAELHTSDFMSPFSHLPVPPMRMPSFPVRHLKFPSPDWHPLSSVTSRHVISVGYHKLRKSPNLALVIKSFSIRSEHVFSTSVCAVNIWYRRRIDYPADFSVRPFLEMKVSFTRIFDIVPCIRKYSQKEDKTWKRKLYCGNTR